MTDSSNKLPKEEAPPIEISGALFMPMDPYGCADFVLPSSGNEVLRITHDKKIIWNGREVATDIELVQALRDLLCRVGTRL